MSIKRILLIPESDYDCLKKSIYSSPPQDQKKSESIATKDSTEVNSEETTTPQDSICEPQQASEAEDSETPDPASLLVNSIPVQFRHCALELLQSLNSEGSLKFDSEARVWLSGVLVPSITPIQFLRRTCVPFTLGALPDELKQHLQRCGVHKVRNHACGLKKPWTPIVVSPVSTKTTPPKASEAPKPSTSRPRRRASRYR